MNNLLQMLGLIQRSRKLSFGPMALESIRCNKSKYVLIASDASDRTKKQFIDKCTFYHVPYDIGYTSEQLSNAIGKSNIKTISINDVGWSKAIQQSINRNGVD